MSRRSHANKSYPRSQRISTLIRNEMALIFRDYLHTPALQQVSMTEVVVADNLSQAVIYYTVMNATDEAEENAVHKKLHSMQPRLYKVLNQRLNMRKVPRIVFQHDHSVKHGAYISALIDQAVAQENVVATDDTTHE